MAAHRSPTVRRFFLLGRLRLQHGKALDLRGYRAGVRVGKRVVDETRTDSTGRFLLEWQGRVPEDADVYVFTPKGRKVVAHSILAADLDSPDYMTFEVPRPNEGSLTSLKSRPRREFEVQLTANNDQAVRVECACLPVKLRWSVRPAEVRGLSGGKIRAALFADGHKIQDDLPMEGERSVTEDHTVVYEIHAGRGKAVQTEKVEVKRFPSLALSYYHPSSGPGGSVIIGIRTTCPAPEGGLKVALRSTLGELGDSEVVIPAGGNWAETELRLGTKKGPLSVIGTASHCLRDSIDLPNPS